MRRLLILGAILASCSGLQFRHSNRQPVVQESGEVVTKSFYFFAAPDDEDFGQRSGKRVPSTAKKNVEVVVIKAPEYNSYTDTAINLAKQSHQTKTVVYMFSKQPDTAELMRTFHQIYRSQKPEVRFIKYKTPEEARRFMEAIGSAQFDAQANSLDAPGAPKFDNTDTAPQSIDTGSYDDDDLFTARHPPFLPTGVDVVPGSSYLPPNRD